MKKTASNTKEERFVDFDEARERLCVKSRTTLYYWQRDGIMPKARKIGPQKRGWLASEFDEFLRSRES
jgi:predicted DNA-binding transcriptional regulator AlpA